MLHDVTRIGRRGGWLAIALAALLVGPAPLAGAQQPQQPKVPLDGNKPLSCDCMQACFDGYVANAGRCESVWCTKLLFITLFCDDDALSDCMSKASAAFDDCLEDCG